MSVQRLLLFGGGGVIVLVAIVIAGWWFLIRDDAELATEPPEIPTELIQATTAPSADGDPTAVPGDSDALTFRVIPEQSEAAYFAGEKLASLPLPSTAKGATNNIEGTVSLAADGTALATGETSSFSVDLTGLTSDEGRRDSRVQDALETNQFPTATFTLTVATGYDPAVPDGEDQSISLTGLLDLHGVQREVTWDVLVRRESNVISALATVSFDYADFNIDPPSIAGFVTVEDDVTLQVQLIAELV